MESKLAVVWGQGHTGKIGIVRDPAWPLHNMQAFKILNGFSVRHIDPEGDSYENVLVDEIL